MFVLKLLRLSVDLQNKIKSKVKETTDLDVKEVNINVKKVTQERQPKEPKTQA